MPKIRKTGRYYADMLADKIVAEGPETVLAFIIEPIGGASTGALVPPAGYMQRIREICDEFGVLLIHDEVMTGAGRTGKFWGAEHWGTIPGHHCHLQGLWAAAMCRSGPWWRGDDMVETVLDAGGFQHGHTYAGNPLACVAGLAVIEEIERLGLIDNAAKMGNLLKARLLGLMNRYPFIGDVRGKGLLLAFELVADRVTMQPLKKELNAFQRLVDLAYDEGLIIYSRRTRGGLEGDHFLVAPPMIITEEGLDELMKKLGKALDRFAKETGLG